MGRFYAGPSERRANYYDINVNSERSQCERDFPPGGVLCLKFVVKKVLFFA